MKKYLTIILLLLSLLCNAQSGWLNYSGAKNYAMWTTKWLQADNTFYWKGDTIKKELLGYFDLKSDSLRVKYIGGTWSPWYYAGRSSYTLPIASPTVLGGIKVGSGLSITNGVLSATASYTTQTLLGTNITWDLSNGKDATLILTGNTVITITNATQGLTGTLWVTNASSIYTITFAGYVNAIDPYIRLGSNMVITSGGGKSDDYTYKYDGTKLNWNGTLNRN